MILDTLNHCHRYFAVHPGFKEIFAFLLKSGIRDFTPGHQQLGESHVEIMIEEVEGKARKDTRLQARHHHIHIQFTLSGEEEIGWIPLYHAHIPYHRYEEEKDIELFYESPHLWLPLPPKTFAIFFPRDAHAPGAGIGKIHKVTFTLPISPLESEWPDG